MRHSGGKVLFGMILRKACRGMKFMNGQLFSTTYRNQF